MKTKPVNIFKAFGVGDVLYILDNENRLWKLIEPHGIWFQVEPPCVQTEERDEKEWEHA